MQVEGIPDGWELVRIGRVKRGEFRLSNFGQPIHWEDSQESGSVNYVIIRKIKKPKRYRPFANAAEYRPFKDSWLFRVDEFGKQLPGEWRVSGFDDEGIWLCDNHHSYEKAFALGRRFADGTPFGVEVTE